MEAVAARHIVVVCVGSNAPDRLSHLNEAEAFLRGLLSDCVFSQTLDSADTSGLTGLRYSNRLCRGYCVVGYEELNRLMKDFESGRRRTNSCGEVEIDLDVVLFDNAVKRPDTYRTSYFQYLYSDLV